MADRTPTVASGARTTVAGIVSTRLKVDMGDIYMYEAEGTALFTTVSLLGKESAHAKTVAWHTSELRPKFMRVNAGTLTSGTTTITVDTPMGGFVVPGMIVEVTRTGEQMLTVTGGSATTIEVSRSWGGTAAAALLDNDELLIIGNAYAESASLQSALTVTETQYTNNIQTMRHNWNIGGLLQAISDNGGTYGGKEPKIQRRLMLETHKRDCNLAMLFSEAATSSSRATMDGLVPFVRDNATGNVNAATVLTEPVFEAGNEVFFRGGSQENRILIASRKVHGIINQFPSSVIRTKSGDTSYGLNMTDYQSAHGKIKIVREVALEGDKYGAYAVGLDPKAVKMRYVRDTRMLKDRQGVSEDGYEEEVLTDLSAEWGSPESCYLWNAIAS